MHIKHGCFQMDWGLMRSPLWFLSATEKKHPWQQRRWIPSCTCLVFTVHILCWLNSTVYMFSLTLIHHSGLYVLLVFAWVSSHHQETYMLGFML